MQTITRIVYIPVANGPRPRPQRLTDIYEFTCTCGNFLELTELRDVTCPSCGTHWDRIVWEQEAVEDERPAVCPNPECPHGA